MTKMGITVIFLCCFLKGSAQGSMMDEVSEPYLAKLIKTAKENYPRQKIHLKQMKIAQNNLNKISLSWLDGVGIYYLYLPATAAGGTINPITSKTGGGFQFGFSFNIGSLLEKPAQINAARGERDVATLEKQEYELNIEADVKERYYKYIQQHILLKQRTQLVLDAQTMLNSVRSKFERGQETFGNFTNALVFYNEQNQGKINTETEMLVTKSHLEEILTKKLEDIQLDDIKSTTKPAEVK